MSLLVPTTHHVALLPSSGMGHLTPFLRLAALLLQNHCHVTLITPQPTVSKAEELLISQFHSSFPQVNKLEFHLLPSYDTDASTASTDPFYLQFASIRRSSHLLSPLLASLSPPLSAFIFDMTLISPILPILESLGVPHYILFTSSATMFSFFSYFPSVAGSASSSDVVEIPEVDTIPRSSIPPPLLIPNSLFSKIFMEDSPKLKKLHGVLINTFEGLEGNVLEALNNGEVVKELPPIYGVGPFVPCEFEKIEQNGVTSATPSNWLDDQPDGSVVYVSFGSRTAVGRDQIREIGEGLVRSGYKFLWVVKDKKVDREEKGEEGLEEVLGFELMKRIKENGLVVKKWVDQSEILSHKSVGGFVSHCGWNSVIEAAWFGVPIMGWPQIGDQKINAELVSKGGWGVWKKEWGWEGECVVKGEEIGEAIKEMMSDESVGIKAAEVKEAAREAASVGGGSKVAIQALKEVWKKKVGKN
ncbi:UDP-glycosyltransferase 708G1-like [Vicia villosa]|uniref:UDP-glycosyltransferase 708G1-like n=1 Tax=Vicia villosa TaxID=3911 RepID=UPI00273B71D1|nr:UDP-glycosyltransferase 708G1-like [Vicia villosa]